MNDTIPTEPCVMCGKLNTFLMFCEGLCLHCGDAIQTADDWPGNLLKGFAAACTSNKKSEARVVELEGALGMWVNANGGGGLHLGGCQSEQGGECDCGLSEARDILQPKTAKSKAPLGYPSGDSSPEWPDHWNDDMFCDKCGVLKVSCQCDAAKADSR